MSSNDPLSTGRSHGVGTGPVWQDLDRGSLTRTVEYRGKIFKRMFGEIGGKDFLKAWNTIAQALGNLKCLFTLSGVTKKNVNYFSKMQNNFEVIQKEIAAGDILSLSSAQAHITSLSENCDKMLKKYISMTPVIPKVAEDVNKLKKALMDALKNLNEQLEKIKKGGQPPQPQSQPRPQAQPQAQAQPGPYRQNLTRKSLLHKRLLKNKSKQILLKALMKLHKQ